MDVHCIYKTKINYPTKYLLKCCHSYSTTLWKIINDIHTSLLTGSLQEVRLLKLIIFILHKLKPSPV